VRTCCIQKKLDYRRCSVPCLRDSCELGVFWFQCFLLLLLRLIFNKHSYIPKKSRLQKVFCAMSAWFAAPARGKMLGGIVLHFTLVSCDRGSEAHTWNASRYGRRKRSRSCSRRVKIWNATYPTRTVKCHTYEWKSFRRPLEASRYGCAWRW